jgi:hypothetical protein
VTKGLETIKVRQPEDIPKYLLYRNDTVKYDCDMIGLKYRFNFDPVNLCNTQYTKYDIMHIIIESN